MAIRSISRAQSEAPVNLSAIAIRRPVFTVMVIFALMVLGLMGLSRIGTDLFPDVTFPVAAHGVANRVQVVVPRPALCGNPVATLLVAFFVVVNALLDGEAVTTCPYIWVDRDFALARGWIQGFPKKLGSIHITRHFPLPSRAAPELGPGGRFAGTLAAGDRRLAYGAVSLEREAESGPTHNDPPLVNVRHFPRLDSGRHEEPAVHELVRARGRDREISPIWEGAVELELYPAPHEELSALAPVRVGKGFRFTFAYVVDDLETVRDYTGARLEVAADP